MSPAIDSTAAEVPQRGGVRDLGRKRLELAEKLTVKGVGGAERRKALCDLVTARLEEHWREVGGPESGAGLGVVGSVARYDAGPASDLDLVLIHDDKSLSEDELADLAHRLWYPIWDAKIPLDHSVRSLEDCRDVASRDPVAAAGLLDLRPVAGDTELVEQAKSTILEDWRTTARKHLPDLLSGSRDRAQRFGELAFLSEPNLKESRGGLRDYSNLTALTATWLADRPHGEVDEAAEYLMNVRDVLQVVSGGPQVVLGRHVARKVAAHMGFREPDDLLAALANIGRRIAYALDITERDARRVLERAERGSHIFQARRRNVAPSYVPVAPGLIEVGSDLSLAPGVRPEGDALLPLRVGSVAATMGLSPSPRLLEALPKTPDLPDPWPPEALSLFLDLLRSSDHLFDVWEALDLDGAIVRWLPEWKGIRNRPHNSPVHRFTVDRHSVEAVIQAGPLTSSVEDPDLLLLSLLFHDLGKCSSYEDHSVVGASFIPKIVARMGIEGQRAKDLKTLVRHHLLLAELATSEDPKAPETVAALLEPLDYRLDLLDTLRALTEADAIAAGPKAWNPWRQALIETLTLNARAELASR